MQHEVKIPSLGESIVSGVITRWNFNSGDYVHQGEVLYELETDKITSEGAAEVSGVVQILAEVESEVAIGQIVAHIDDAAPAGSDTSKSVEVAPVSSEKSTAVPQVHSTGDQKYSPAVARLAAETGIHPASIHGTGKDGRVTKGDMLEAGKE